MSALILTVGAAVAAGAGVFSRAVFMPRSQICGKVIYRGPREHPPRIAITFDDGPDENTTPRVLDCLRTHGVTATFFVVGRHASQSAHLVARIDAEGHLVANHSFEHAHFGSIRRDRYWNEEIRRTDDVIEQIIGKRPAIFRPPMGFKTFHIMAAAKRQGHSTVTWSRRAFDGVQTAPQQIVSHLRKARAGDIILLHDGAVAPFRSHPHGTVAALDHLLKFWRERGVTLQRLDQFLQLPAYHNQTINSALPKQAIQTA